jgi:hypothetical protein
VGLIYHAQIQGLSTPGNPYSLDPTGFSHPAVDSGFGFNYDTDIIALAGIVSYVIDNNNYKVSHDGQRFLAAHR